MVLRQRFYFSSARSSLPGNAQTLFPGDLIPSVPDPRRPGVCGASGQSKNRRSSRRSRTSREVIQQSIRKPKTPFSLDEPLQCPVEAMIWRKTRDGSPCTRMYRPASGRRTISAASRKPHVSTRERTTNIQRREPQAVAEAGNRLPRVHLVWVRDRCRLKPRAISRKSRQIR